MKSTILPFTLGLVSITATASAQYVKVDVKADGFGKDVFYGAAYDRSHVVTIKAKVRGISRTPGENSDQAGDVALLVSPFEMAVDRYGEDRMVFLEGYLNVELGPDWYVNAQSLKLRPNDYVEITGSKVRLRGETVLIAQTVRRGFDTLALHRASGEPYWYAFKKPTTTAPPASDSTSINDTTPPPVNRDEYQPEQQYDPRLGVQFGPSTIYGGAYSITNSPFGFGQTGLIGSRPLVPLGGNPLVIVGNWYRF